MWCDGGVREKGKAGEVRKWHFGRNYYKKPREFGIDNIRSDSVLWAVRDRMLELLLIMFLKIAWKFGLGRRSWNLVCWGSHSFVCRILLTRNEVMTATFD